jgi:hypothetical protein
LTWLMPGSWSYTMDSAAKTQGQEYKENFYLAW